MIKTAIIGATGYTGIELIRILSRHPQVKITAATSRQYAGRKFDSVYPSCISVCDLTLEPLEPEKTASKADFIFTALPHSESMQVVPFLLEKGKKVIDLSADYRFENKQLYEKWYKKHTSSNILKKAVYGMPELWRKDIKKAGLVANPGCYPTSIILALAPLLKRELISINTIIADSKSGVTGAGRGLKLSSLFSEASDNFKAYGVFSHRHQPEIEEKVSIIAGKSVSMVFTPHLLPVNRGILSTIYVNLKNSLDRKAVEAVYNEFYGKEHFIRILPDGVLPQTGWVRGSNYCDIGFCLKGKKMIVVSAIDNLVKGASGQAVQNFNIMAGFKENTALESAPLYP